jgi:hypothetical protein
MTIEMRMTTRIRTIARMNAEATKAIPNKAFIPDVGA